MATDWDLINNRLSGKNSGQPAKSNTNWDEINARLGGGSGQQQNEQPAAKPAQLKDTVYGKMQSQKKTDYFAPQMSIAPEIAAKTHRQSDTNPRRGRPGG